MNVTLDPNALLNQPHHHVLGLLGLPLLLTIAVLSSVSLANAPPLLPQIEQDIDDEHSEDSR